MCISLHCYIDGSICIDNIKWNDSIPDITTRSAQLICNVNANKQSLSGNKSNALLHALQVTLKMMKQ